MRAAQMCAVACMYKVLCYLYMLYIRKCESSIVNGYQIWISYTRKRHLDSGHMHAIPPPSMPLTNEYLGSSQETRQPANDGLASMIYYSHHAGSYLKCFICHRLHVNQIFISARARPIVYYISACTLAHHTHVKNGNNKTQ